MLEALGYGDFLSIVKYVQNEKKWKCLKRSTANWKKTVMEFREETFACNETVASF